MFYIGCLSRVDWQKNALFIFVNPYRCTRKILVLLLTSVTVYMVIKILHEHSFVFKVSDTMSKKYDYIKNANWVVFFHIS